MLGSPARLRGGLGAGERTPDTVIARALLVRIPHNPAAGEGEGDSYRVHFRRYIRRTVVKRGVDQEEGDILGSPQSHKRILMAPETPHSPGRRVGGLVQAVAEVDTRPERSRRVHMGMVDDLGTQHPSSDIHFHVVEPGILDRVGHHRAVREAVEVDNFALALYIRKGQLGGTHSSHIPSFSLLRGIAHGWVHGYDGAQGYRVPRSLPFPFLYAFSLFSPPSHAFCVPSRGNIHHPSLCSTSHFQNTLRQNPRHTSSCNAPRNRNRPRNDARMSVSLNHICWISPYFSRKYEFARLIMG